MTAPPAAAIEVRRLAYADLPQVVAIERRAFPTPWSLAMFVLELSKPSGVCLAAFMEGRLAVGVPVGGPDQILPEYLRLPDAQTTAQRAR